MLSNVDNLLIMLINVTKFIDTCLDQNYHIPMDRLKRQLSILGLSRKEAEVYTSLLNHGKGTITDISKWTGIKRTTVYEYLQTLLVQNLVSKTAEKKRIYYCLEHPRRIRGLFAEQTRQLEEKRSKAERLIPELESIYACSFSRPSVNFYEGKEGLKHVYQEIFSTHKNIYSLFSPNNFFKLFSARENHELVMTLFKSGGLLHSLVEKADASVNRLLERPEYNKFIKSKQLPDGFKFDTDLLVVGDTVAMISFKNLVGVVIKDKAIAELQRKFIDFLWKGTV